MCLSYIRVFPGPSSRCLSCVHLSTELFNLCFSDAQGAVPLVTALVSFCCAKNAVLAIPICNLQSAQCAVSAKGQGHK